MMGVDWWWYCLHKVTDDRGYNCTDIPGSLKHCYLHLRDNQLSVIDMFWGLSWAKTLGCWERRWSLRSFLLADQYAVWTLQQENTSSWGLTTCNSFTWAASRNWLTVKSESPLVSAIRPKCVTNRFACFESVSDICVTIISNMWASTCDRWLIPDPCWDRWKSRAPNSSLYVSCIL